MQIGPTLARVAREGRPRGSTARVDREGRRQHGRRAQAARGCQGYDAAVAGKRWSCIRQSTPIISVGLIGCQGYDAAVAGKRWSCIRQSTPIISVGLIGCQTLSPCSGSLEKTRWETKPSVDGLSHSGA